jgi:alkanesulfonate monooxygenase SsuD/methylene tetrahydromethanopterin reductase-like flavin-dependent oxidoreductase (luciferase family)
MASMKGLIQSRKTITGGYRTMEQMLEQGTFICGSPQTVIEQLAEYQRRGGFNIVMAGLHFGTLPHALTMKSIAIFARDVMPALKGAVPGEVPRVAAE